jgi:hypothetical protein
MGDFASSERHFLLSLEKNPNYIFCLVSYAKFLSETLQDYDAAEKYA